MAELNGNGSGGLRSILSRHAPKTLKRVYRNLRGIDDPEAMWKRIDTMRRRFRRNSPVKLAFNPKKILFNSQFSWPYAVVEYTVAAALRERGHEVKMFACGGLPKYCELMTSTQERPPCDVCRVNVESRFKAFGLPHSAVSDYLTDKDREQAAHSATAPMETLRGLVEDGVPVGEIAFFNLFQYFKGYPFDMSGELGEVYRSALSSAILVTRGAARILDEIRPDVVCTANGKFLQWSPFIYQAAKRKIHYVTWEDYQIRPGAVAFAANEIAHESKQSAVWRAELEKPLTDTELRTVREHYSLWSKGEVTPWAGYTSSVTSSATALRSRLWLRDGAPVIALFPNLSWDASSVGFETAFSNMYDWLYTVVAYAGKRPDVEFVVRAHPAEARLPQQYRPPVPVCDAVRREFGSVPGNVHLVEGGEPVSSYELAEIASINMVYTSTLGIELPLRGIRPWAAAGPYYAGKGFTVDIESASHMISLLDADTFDNRLTPEQVARAERMAYLIRFRGVFDFPFMPSAGEFAAPNWDVLAPGGDRLVEAICTKVLNREPFIDLTAWQAPAGQPAQVVA